MQELDSRTSGQAMAQLVHESVLGQIIVGMQTQGRRIRKHDQWGPSHAILLVFLASAWCAQCGNRRPQITPMEKLTRLQKEPEE